MSCGTICCTVIKVCQEAQAGLLSELHLNYLQQALPMTDVSMVGAGFSKVTFGVANHKRNTLRKPKPRTLIRLCGALLLMLI